MNYFENNGKKAQQTILGWNSAVKPEVINKLQSFRQGAPLSQRSQKAGNIPSGRLAKKMASVIWAIGTDIAGGFITDNYIGCQWASETHGVTTVMLYDKNKHTAKAGAIDPSDGSLGPYKPEYGYKILCVLAHFLAHHDDEYADNFEIACEEFGKVSDPDNDNLSEEGTDALTIMTDGMYRQIAEENETYFVLEMDELSDLQAIQPDELKISEGLLLAEGLIDAFDVGSTLNTTQTSKPKEDDYKPGAFDLGDRVFTKAEQDMLDAGRLDSSIIISEEAVGVAQCIQETTNDPIPARTFLFSGPAGNGKSTTAQCVATLINRPFIRQSLGPDSDKFDLLSSTQPNTNKGAEIDEGKICADAGIPTFVELQFDCLGAYEALTGLTPVINGDSVTIGTRSFCKEDFIYEVTAKWKEAYSKALEEAKSSVSSDFLFVDSPIIKAAKYGWVVEIQEPTLVLNSGELGLLNSLLEEGVAYLPSGELIKRHPDNVVIFTTNYGYEGCNALNQALRDRCRKELTFELPPEAVLIERVSLRSGNTDKKQVKDMVQFVDSLRTFCKKQMIGDGEIGERSLINWAADTAHGHSAYDMCKEDVLNKAASDPNERETLYDFLDNSVFKKTRRKTV